MTDTSLNTATRSRLTARPVAEHRPPGSARREAARRAALASFPSVLSQRFHEPVARTADPSFGFLTMPRNGMVA